MMALFQAVVFLTWFAMGSSFNKVTAPCKRDVIVLYDMSYPLIRDEKDFDRYVRPFLHAFVKSRRLNVNKEGTNVAFISFSSKDRIKNVFRSNDQRDIVHALNKGVFIESISSDDKRKSIGGVLRKVHDEEFRQKSPRNVRPDSPDVVVLVTDGNVGRDYRADYYAKKWASILKDDKDIKVFGALVGQKNSRDRYRESLETIISNAGHTFEFDDDYGRFPDVDNLVKAMCYENGQPPKPNPEPPVEPTPPPKQTTRPPPEQTTKSPPEQTTKPPTTPTAGCNKPQIKSDGPLPTFSTFQNASTSSDDLSGKTFKINDQCFVKASKTDSLYQLTTLPEPDCLNLASLLKFVLPKDKGNFDMDSTGFMVTQNIIIRSLSLNTETKGVEIAGGYNGSFDIIPDILSMSNVRMQISFVYTRSKKFTFDISASLTVGSVTMDVGMVRNEEGYFLTASSQSQITATDIAKLFKSTNSFLPVTCLQRRLRDAKFDSFAIQKLRLRAAFTEGYGFLFGGQIRILDWELFDVNVLINKPNDSPKSITIAVYTPSFSIPRMFKDLFDMDLTGVPVLGTAIMRNIALTISTHEVDTPLTVLDIGSQEIFAKPYQKGLSLTFEVQIVDVYIGMSILIAPSKLRLAMTQSGELTLGKVVQSFLSGVKNVTSSDGGNLTGWPSFIKDPLEIAVTVFEVEATQISKKWTMSYLKVHVELVQPLTFFSDKIRITDLSFDMTYTKMDNRTEKSGLISASISIGSSVNATPSVDIKIPFPFNNQEITFTFTDFSFQKIAASLGFTQVLPTKFTEFLAQIQLDLIALTFNGDGKLNKVSVKASIPQVWTIFGTFSIGNVKMIVEFDGIAGDKANKNWEVKVTGDIIISSCTISVATTVGKNLVTFDASGESCSVSVGDVLTKISVNPNVLPSMITGFAMSKPQLWFKWDRTTNEKAMGFAADTNLFGNSKVEVGLISARGKTGVVAAFAVQAASSVSGLDFLSKLGLSDIAVVYISEKMALAPYEWRKDVFKKYIPEEKQANHGLTIFAKFVPSDSNLLGKLLKKAGNAELTLSLTVPDFYAVVEVKGNADLTGNMGGQFVDMKLIISKSLIALSLKFRVVLQKNQPPMEFTGELSFTFGATVTLSLLWEGKWAKPFGLQRFEIYRLGLALGINVVSLAPSFGITGAIKVMPLGASPILANLTLCIDTANIASLVLDLSFSRFLLGDIVNTFAKSQVNLPSKFAEMGFPDPVNIFVSPEGNDDCFGKKYEAGVEIHGTFQIPFLSVRARADISIKFEPFHLKADLQMDPINFGNGLLKIVSARSDSVGPYLHLNIGTSLSELRINGSCRIHLFGASVSIELIINQHQLYFETSLNLWSLFRVYFKVDLSLTKKSLHIVGEMQNDLFAKIKQRAAQGIQRGARVVYQKIEAAQRKVRNAENEVRKLDGYINYHERKISEAKHECSRAPWYKKYICIGTGFKITYHGGIIAALWVSKNVALGVLKAADLFLDGVKGAVKIGANVLQRLVNAALSVIDIQYVRFEVNLSAQKQVFRFNARIVVLGWTFTPSFDIDFSSSSKANEGINKFGDHVSSNTVKNIE